MKIGPKFSPHVISDFPQALQNVHLPKQKQNFIDFL